MMLKNTLLQRTFAAAFLLTAATPLSAGGNDSYHPFPDGFGYLQDQATLENGIETSNRVPLREHGWKLWAGIMQQPTDMSWPVWYSWPNATDVYQRPYPIHIPCGLAENEKQTPSAPTGMLGLNANNTILDNLVTPQYPVPQKVITDYPTAVYWDVSARACNIKDGKHFQFNGDIMIPTESFSLEGANWITGNGLNRKKTLKQLADSGTHLLHAPEKHIVTKHMYWPVLKDQLGVLPVWNNEFGPTFTDYAGYEMWRQAVAIDPTGKKAGQTVQTEYLYGVSFKDVTTKNPPKMPIQGSSKVHDISDFYYHQVTEEDWKSFNDADKAILNASSYWAYNKPFGVGDYLVTVAMHVNTKEVPSWSLNSVWWSATPDGGPYSLNKPADLVAEGPWKHYELVTSYDITPPNNQDMPVEMNPYIELVIHPVATNCQNCHIRAGFQSSYQAKACQNMLGHLTTDSDCLKDLLLTDYQWTIPDRAF